METNPYLLHEKQACKFYVDATPTLVSHRISLISLRVLTSTHKKKYSAREIWHCKQTSKIRSFNLKSKASWLYATINTFKGHYPDLSRLSNMAKLIENISTQDIEEDITLEAFIHGHEKASTSCFKHLLSIHNIHEVMSCMIDYDLWQAQDTTLLEPSSLLYLLWHNQRDFFEAIPWNRGLCLILASKDSTIFFQRKYLLEAILYSFDRDHRLVLMEHLLNIATTEILCYFTQKKRKLMKTPLCFDSSTWNKLMATSLKD